MCKGALLLKFLSPFPFLSSPLVKASRIALCVDHACIFTFILVNVFLRFPSNAKLDYKCWISHVKWVKLLEDLNGLEIGGLVMKMNCLQAWKCEF